MTEYWRNVAAMGLAASIQKFMLWQCRWPDPSQPVVVCIDGFPEVVDITALVPWKVLRTSLREWSFEPSTESQHCWSLTASALTCEREWDLKDSATPTLLVIEALMGAGWRAAPKAEVPEAHHPGAARAQLRFALRDFVYWKAYYQCLFSLDSICQKGLESLPSSGQCPGFYRCVLDSLSPATIPPGKSDKFYKSYLEGSPIDDYVPPGVSTDDVPMASSSACDDVPMESACGVGSSIRPAMPARPRGRGQAGKHGRRKVVARPALEEVDNLLWGSVPILRSPSSSSSSSSSGSSSSSSNSSSSGCSNSSSRDRHVSPPSPSVGPLQHERSRSRSRARLASNCSDHIEGGSSGGADHASGSLPRGVHDQGRDNGRVLVDCVEGMTVFEDKHGVPGTPKFYRRLYVQCSCPDRHGNKCSKRRNIGIAQTKHFGAKEPLAFLGVWLRQGNSCSGRDEHIQFQPKVGQVEEYMREHQWL